MRIYLFGNPDYQPDSKAIEIAEKLKPVLPQIDFVTVKPNEDLPFNDNERVIILDSVMGIDEVTVITEKHLDKLQLPPRYSAHDFDLGFQLKYLKKLGKIKSFTIIGLPMEGKFGTDKVIALINKLTHQSGL